jgi:hypothetical protein
MAAHRYWRLFVSSVVGSPNWCTIDEVELRTTPGGVTVTDAATVVTASSNYNGGSSAPAHVTDKTSGTFWTSATGTVQPSNPCWLMFDLGAPQAVVEFSITPLSGLPDRAPNSFALQASDDGVNWPPFSQIIPLQAPWTNTEKRVFSFAEYFLAGNAKLDTGVAASLVVVRAWDTHAHVMQSVPASDGSWKVFVTSGNYDVTVVGPSGYQPITHGPVVAVAAT